MLRVVFLARGVRLTGFTASGHARFAPHGGDIVCAGVSALLITVAMEIKRIGIPALVMQRNGYMLLRVGAGAAEEGRNTASMLLRAALTGVKAMTVKYGKRVKVSVRQLSSV